MLLLGEIETYLEELARGQDQVTEETENEQLNDVSFEEYWSDFSDEDY